MPRNFALAPAAAVLAAALVAGLTPPPARSIADWADEKRYVAAESGSPYPGRWRTDRVPYLREIMEVLSLNHPARDVTFAKSAQVAGTEAGLNLFGSVVDENPCPMLIVLPSIEEAQKYNRVKLQPAIDETPALRHKVREARSRSEQGSTGAFKRFAGGYAMVTGANSSKGLQMVSYRVVVLEEISEWPFDVDNRGDPVDLALARTKAWSHNAKRFFVSTPGLAGETATGEPLCRISAKYEASDQRRYYVPCPHCGAYQILEWDNLRYETDGPPKAHFVCQAHGCVIEPGSKRAMIAAGVWLKTYPGDDAPGTALAPDALEAARARPAAGRSPGFHIWQAYSPFVEWDDTVLEWRAAEGNSTKEKVFTQQGLGLAYEEKGEAPAWELLHRRREPYATGRIPPGGLFLSAGADVQMDRIECEIVAWGLGKTSWSVEYYVLEGDTNEPEVWRQLSQIYARQYEDRNGKTWPIEMFAIDSGYRPQKVYAWTRGLPRAMATKGMGRVNHPALGTPSKQDLKADGKRAEGSVLLWPVGTWALKAELYGYLRLEGGEPGAEAFPPGYCHFPSAYDETHFQQLTAEHLVNRETRTGYVMREWVKIRPRNEQLDIRVLAMAAAHHMGIDRMDPAAWQRLAAERGAPIDQAQADMASLWAPGVVTPPRTNAVRGRRVLSKGIN